MEAKTIVNWDAWAGTEAERLQEAPAAGQYIACIKAGRPQMALGLFEDLSIALMRADCRADDGFKALLEDVLDVYRAAVEAEKTDSEDDDCEDCNTHWLEQQLRRVVRESPRKRDFWKQLFQRFLNADACSRILGSNHARNLTSPV